VWSITALSLGILMRIFILKLCCLKMFLQYAFQFGLLYRCCRDALKIRCHTFFHTRNVNKRFLFSAEESLCKSFVAILKFVAILNFLIISSGFLLLDSKSWEGPPHILLKILLFAILLPILRQVL